MNEICPYCHEPQRFPIDCIDTVVHCQKCAKPFLLSHRPRDEAPSRRMKRRSIAIAVLGVFLFTVACVITVWALREHRWVTLAGFCGAIWGVLAILVRAIGPDRLTEGGSLVLGVVVGPLTGTVILAIPTAIAAVVGEEKLMFGPVGAVVFTALVGAIGGVIIGCIAGVITRKVLRKDKSRP